MKLKTLKDIEIFESDENKSPTENVEWFKIQLKQEAIKWVNFFRSKEREMEDWDFMDFFNITEDDLK